MTGLLKNPKPNEDVSLRTIDNSSRLRSREAPLSWPASQQLSIVQTDPLPSMESKSANQMKTSTFSPFRPKQMFSLALVLTLTAWLSACSTSTPRGSTGQQTAWTFFTSYDGGFSVLMPMRPQESIKEHPETNGPPVKQHDFIVDPNDSIELGVIYNDYPESLPNIATVGSPSFFDTLQQAVLKQLGDGRLISSRDGQFASHPMREIRFDVPHKRLIYHTRIIVVGHRMYQLMVVSRMEVDVSREVQTLFNSFRLLYNDEPR